MEQIILARHCQTELLASGDSGTRRFEEAESYFKTVGQVLVLRRDWQKGDKVWHIEDKFTPDQEIKECN